MLGYDGEEWVIEPERVYCAACQVRTPLVVQLRGGQLVATCKICWKFVKNIPRDEFDALRRGENPPVRTSPSARRPTSATRERAERMAENRCVHCLLEERYGKPRRFKLPKNWISRRPEVQLSILADAKSPIEISLSERFPIGAFEHFDHIFGEAIEKRILDDAPEIVRILIRKVWGVPSCASHNNLRRETIEETPYLLRIFAYYSDSADLDFVDETLQLNMFIDMVKQARLHMRNEDRALKRAAKDDRG